MKFQVMNVDGRSVIINSEDFVNSGNYSAVPLSLENVCKLMNDKENQTSKIDAIIRNIRCEQSNSCLDDSVANVLVKQLEDLKAGT